MIAAMGVVALSPAPPLASAATPGGRVTLNDFGPSPYFDSRLYPNPKITRLPVGSEINGLVRIFLYDPEGAGEAYVYPCSGSPGADPSFAYVAGGMAVYTAAAESSCLFLTSPAFVVIVRMGTIDPAPVATGLQYQPLATPRKVYEASPYRLADSTAVVPLTGVPSTARGAVVLVEVPNPDDSWYANVSGKRCNEPGSVTVVYQQGQRAAGLNYVAIDPGNPTLCVQLGRDQIARLTLLGFLVTDGADNTRLPPVLLSAVHESPPPGLEPLSPKRLLDTRRPDGPTQGAKVAAGSTLELPIPQATGLTVSAVLNVTVVEPDGDGFLTVYPCDAPLPVVSNLNYSPGDVVPNLVNVKVSVTRTVCVFAQRATHLVVDLSGIFEAAGGAGVAPVVPKRILDTREPIGVSTKAPVLAGQSIRIQVAGAVPGVPSSGVSAATMNVTVDGAQGAGFVTAYPCDQPRPEASNLNFVPGSPVPNLVTVRLAADGSVCLYSSATTDLVADLTAWYGDDRPDGFKPVVPERYLDTRTGLGTTGSGKVEPNSTLRIQIAGRGGVPSTGATGVAVNVTAVDPDGSGYVTVFPCDAPERPATSNLNFERGDIVPNLVFTKLSLTGALCLFSTARSDLLVDVAGYFTQATELVRAPFPVG